MSIETDMQSCASQEVQEAMLEAERLRQSTDTTVTIRRSQNNDDK